MASRATRRVLLSLGMTKGVLELISDYYKHKKRNKTVMELIDITNKKTDRAIQFWKDQLSSKEVQKIHDNFKHIENNITGRYPDIVVMTSLISGTVSDVRDHLKGAKRVALNDLLVSVKRLNRHFDRHLDQFEMYDLANKAIKEISL